MLSMILEKLIDEKIVSFEITEDRKKVKLLELSNFYYEADLTKKELALLIEELINLKNEMIL